MKRFIGKLALLVAIFTAIVVTMHIIAIYNLQDAVNATYTISKDVKYLFLGSSQVGCSIEERPELHNKVIWVSSTSAPAWYVRLLELERRGQLDNLEAVIVPYNYLIPLQQNANTLRWAFYQELPITWRHVEIVPYSVCNLIVYIFSNLRFPFHIQANSGYPGGRPSIASRPNAWREKNLAAFVRESSTIKLGDGCHPKWESVTREAYEGLLAICKKHHLRFIVYRQPVLEQCYAAVPQAIKEYEESEIVRYQSLGMEVIDMPHFYSETYFFDSVHFIETGRKVFTDELFSIINKSNAKITNYNPNMELSEWRKSKQ